MENLKIQLSLAISGREAEARKEAAELTEKLRAAGYEVYNPLEMCADIEERSGNKVKGWWNCVIECCSNVIKGNVDVLLVSRTARGTNRKSIGVEIETLVAAKAKLNSYFGLNNFEVYTQGGVDITALSALLEG